jgi:hypothetical protein
MSWAKVDDQYPDHPKTVAAGLLGELLNFHAWCYAARFLTDGKIANAMANRMANDIANRMASDYGLAINGCDLIGAVVRAGLWEQDDEDYIIHDFHDYNPAAADVKQKRNDLSEVRSEAGKRGAQARWQNGKSDGKRHGKTMAPYPLTSKDVINAKTRVRGKAVPPYSAEFEVFWRAMPMPGGDRDKGSKRNAYKVWLELTEDEQRAATVGAGLYARQQAAKGDGGLYTKTPEPWLRGRYWEGLKQPAQAPEYPPEGYSWDKDERGRWITLGGNRVTQTGWCYGAHDYDEEEARHKQATAQRRLEVKTA